MEKHLVVSVADDVSASSVIRSGIFFTRLGRMPSIKSDLSRVGLSCYGKRRSHTRSHTNLSDCSLSIHSGTTRRKFKS